MSVRIKNFVQLFTKQVQQTSTYRIYRLCSGSVNNVAPNFDNHKEAFKSKRTLDLIRACSILSVCSIDFIVDNALQLMRTSEKLLGSKIFSIAMKSTFYGQFVAGETGPAVTEAAKHLKGQGLTLMVAPALESDLGEGSSSGLQDNNLKEYLRLAELTGQGNFDNKKTACLQLKMTAVVPTDLLATLTTMLLKKTEAEKTNLVGVLSNYMRSDEENTEEAIHGLSVDLSLELQKACKRLQKIGRKANEMKIRLLVDMEWTYVNPACSAFASAMMVVFNKESPAVCSTVQCYLKEALETIKWEIQVAKHFGVCYGAKLVRGAYLEKEKQVAPHMVCENYDATSQNYDRVMKYAVEKAVQAPDKKKFIIVATHNEAAIISATSFIHKIKASKHPNVAFAQIYGMAEHISLPLAQEDYTVYKSVAFGELHQVVPYLARRAAENRAIMKGARRERDLMMSELQRRFSAIFK